MLSPLPIFRAVYSLGLDVLISTGHTGQRTIAQIAMPPVNILLSCLLVPSYGVIGAAIAALLTHLSLAMATWALVGAVVRQQSAQDPASIEVGKAASESSVSANRTMCQSNDGTNLKIPPTKPDKFDSLER